MVVTEGAARGVEATEGVEVISAAGAGDDAIVAAVAERIDTPDTVIRVATADRGLGSRVTALGARVVSPRLVRN